MKVLLVNGSPHEKGCTHEALNEVKNALEQEGIHADFFWIGDQPIAGCCGCGGCAKAGKCRYDDRVNAFLEIAGSYDGFVFGAPVHFASAGRGPCFRQAGRDNGGAGSAEQIYAVRADADGIFPVLEYGAWAKSAAGAGR